ncbi:DUF4238 domain-containing protein [Candidatus Saccharibacteria bacterium]|nr:DUF4238 domain-containing protein [Candidatus Saccharibacteria bacterium]
MANTPKLHHYVPRSYLRRFTHDGKHVFVLFRKNDRRFTSPKSVNIDKLCAETDFYATFDNNGRKSIVVEQELASFESAVANTVFSQIQPSVIFPYQEGGILLNVKQKIAIVDAIAVQIVRGKSTRNYGLSVIGDIYKKELDALEEKVADDPSLSPDLEYLKKNESRLKTNALAEGAIIELLKNGQESKLRQNLQNRACFVLINTTNLNFLTSDEPVLITRIGSKTKTIFDYPLGRSDSVVYYPLDSRHMIALYAKEHCQTTNNITGNIVLLGENDKEFIQYLNYIQSIQSNRCLIAEEKEGFTEVTDYYP